ncbi:MAG: hypothetical protein M3443_18905, partial [Actinomycetota bacterium]|nr:hypothetical protein [Actinomycetota bacterium]
MDEKRQEAVAVRRKRGGLTTFAAGGIAGTLIGVAAKLGWDGLVDRVADSAVWVSVVLIVAVVILIAMVTLTTRKVDQLIEKASFSINYYPADDPDELYARSREVIKHSDADVEIYAVNS